MEINELLRKVRLENGWSQSYLATELGVDISTYGRYESGKTEIKMSHFLKLIKLYGLKPFKFMETYILNEKFNLVEDPAINAVS